MRRKLRNLKYHYNYFMYKYGKKIKHTALLVIMSLIYAWYFFNWGVQVERHQTPDFRVCEMMSIDFQTSTAVYEKVLEELRNPSDPEQWMEDYEEWRGN